MNITNHIFLPEAARRSVFVCLPSNTAINLRISRNTALSKEHRKQTKRNSDEKSDHQRFGRRQGLSSL